MNDEQQQGDQQQKEKKRAGGPYKSDKYKYIENWRDFHFSRDVKVIDVHAHPVLKMNHLKVAHIAPTIFRPHVGRNPLSRRTSFNRLASGGVDALTSGVVLSEAEVPADFRPFSLMWLQGALRYLPGGNKLPIEKTIDAFEEAQANLNRYNGSCFQRRVSKWRQRRPSREPALPDVEIAESYDHLLAIMKGKKHKIALINSIEGAHALEGADITGIWRPAIDKLRNSDDHHTEEVTLIWDELQRNLEKVAKGHHVAIITLGHYYPNIVTATPFGYPQNVAVDLKRTRKRWKWAHRDLTGGLTTIGTHPDGEIGRRFVQMMCELGVVVDVAHTTPKAREQVYKIVEEAGRPVVASHVGVYEMNPDPYNVTDEEIKRIRHLGGVVGVFFSNYWLVGHEGTDLGVNLISRTIRHLVNVGGHEVVAIGTDFDGMSDPPDDLVDMSEMPRLTQRLMSDGYHPNQIEAMLGGNALRVLKHGWK